MAASKTPLRDHLVRALYADLVGPFEGADAHETSTELIQRPTEWYLTGFLVPEKDRQAPVDELDGQAEGDDAQADDADAETPATKVPKLFPASMGMSVLLPPHAKEVAVRVSFAQYEPERKKDDPSQGGPGRKVWRRVVQPTQTVTIPLTESDVRADRPLPNTPKVFVTGRLGTLTEPPPGLPAGTKALSIFVVNRQEIVDDERGKYGRTLFQVQMELECADGFSRRPNRAGHAARGDEDAQILDLQYRNHVEYAVGHNVAAEPIFEGADVRRVRTRWIPRTEVRLVRPHDEPAVVVAMEALAKLESAAEVGKALDGLPERYADWLKTCEREPLSAEHAKVRADLLVDARIACDRIRAGIALLKSSDELRTAFCLANRAMAMAARQRSPGRYESGSAPAWRLFQLAFVLLNLAGVVDDPHHADRENVELIFFPTGGGKTEAYLGVIAFALLLRRLAGPGRDPTGGSVSPCCSATRCGCSRSISSGAPRRLMCALELLRAETTRSSSATMRFTVGLWVGQERDPEPARSICRTDLEVTRVAAARRRPFRSRRARGARPAARRCELSSAPEQEEAGARRRAVHERRQVPVREPHTRTGCRSCSSTSILSRAPVAS